MNGGRPSAVVVLVALAIACRAPFLMAQEYRNVRDPEADIARALFVEAQQAAGIADWASASLYLTEAGAHDSGDADIMYLRALASIRSSMPLGEALGYLNGALTTGRFTFYTRRDASTLKAEILVRERRWQEALGALSPPEIDSAMDPAYHLIRARALAGLGDSAAFTKELLFSLRRFPDESAFARLFLVHAGIIPVSAEARDIGESIRARLPRYVEVDPEMRVLAAPLLGDISARRDAVIAFRAEGGSSPSATLRSLEYGLLDEASASVELLSGPHPVLLKDLVSLFALAGSPAGREEVFKALLNWSGLIEVDSDGDGITEATFSIDKGSVTNWKLDSRQVGRVDERALFASGLPISIILEREGLEIQVTYTTYPAVSSIIFVEKDEKRRYSFGPEALSFAPIVMRAFAGTGKSALFFPYQGFVTDPTDHLCAAMALSVTIDVPTSRSVTFLDRGLALSTSVIKGDKKYSEMTYLRGSPALERIDADGDGRFETERVYSTAADGVAKPSGLRVDSDGDGIFEYREQLVFPFRKEWDYDGNGSVDALQFQLADGSVEQEFSSRLDNNLDETVIVKSGKIVSLARDGVSIALIPDANPSLTWIGTKSFDLGSNLPAGEGVFSAMGKRYRLTRVGELAFAELVP